MKTFREFIIISEKLNKTFDEDAHTKVWNYFISNPDYTEVRDAIASGDREKALELMRAEIEKARGDANHPLNFSKAEDSEFSIIGTGKNKRANREAGDEEIFNQEIEKAVSGIKSLAGQKKFRDAVERGLPARKTGGSKAELSRTWKGAGGTNATPKADIEIYDPDNEKNRRGVSLKKAGGSQIASAESGELQGTYKAAAKSFVQRFYGDKPKEERLKIEKEINDAARRVGEINTQQRTASDDDQKTELKDAGQEILDKLHDKYPNLTRLVTQASTTGDKKFRGRNAPGSAGTILTGDKAKPAEQQPSARPRNAKSKGRGRPGNVKIDNKEAPTKSNQEQPKQGPISYKEFDRKRRMSELQSKGVGSERDERIAAERERIEQEKQAAEAQRRQERYSLRKAQQQAAEVENQVSQSQADLEKASQEAEKASVPIDPETKKPVLSQFRKNIEAHIATDQTSPTAKVNNQRRQAAQNRVAAAQTNVDNAVANQQALASATPQQPPAGQQPVQPQPQQTQQPPAEQQPVQQQPQQPVQQTPPPKGNQEVQNQPQATPQPKDEKKQRRKKPMDSAGETPELPN